MTIPELLAWCRHGEGTWWLGRLRVKWQIEAEALRRATDAARSGERTEADWAREGWHGGRCDPLEQCAWADEGDLDPNAETWAAA